MRIINIVSVLVVLLALVALPASAEKKISKQALKWTEAAPTDGETLYQSLCAVCHGTDGSGNGPAAEALKTLPPDLRILSAKNDGKFPSKAVFRTIEGTDVAAHGSPEMPIWGHAFVDVRPERKVSTRESQAALRIKNLSKYLESIQTEL